MIFFSIGLPGHFAAWCDAAIARLVEIGLGPVELMSARSADEIAVALIRSTAPHLVIASRQPAPSLCTLLGDSGGPVIVALDDPRRALRDLTSEQGIELRTAIREVACSSAAALVCARLPGAVTVQPGRDRRAAAGLISTLAQSCGLGLGDKELAGVAAAVSHPANSGPIEPWWSALDPDERALADGALAAYVDQFRGGGFGEIVWDQTLFWLAADPSRHAAGAIDIGGDTGRLVYGPDIGLPPGDWAATVTLAVSREAAGIGFDIEVWAAYHHTPLARASVIADARGLCSATLSFGIAAPTAQTISFSIANTAPAPGGRLALGKVTLAPSRGDGSDIPSELSMVLGL